MNKYQKALNSIIDNIEVKEVTELEIKLKQLGFNKYKEQNGDIYYEKEILVFALNSDCTKIRKIHTVRSEGYDTFRLNDLFVTYINTLKEVSQYVI